MERFFLEFTDNKDRRVLIDLNDIRYIEEGGEHSKGFCRMYFYSDIQAQVWIKSDYDNLINKIQKIFINF